jgi:UDP-N-acetylglucosamine 1-carboxyvinyltransferase
MSEVPVLLSDGYIGTRVKGRLRCATIVFPLFTIGATENLLMSASPEGLIIPTNGVRESEIGDLASCLPTMGARMGGISNDMLTIDDVDRVRVVDHPITLARMRDGQQRLCRCDRRRVCLAPRYSTGFPGRRGACPAVETLDALMVKQLNGLYFAGVVTEPYPEFSTDFHRQFKRRCWWWMLPPQSLMKSLKIASRIPGSNRTGSDQFAWNISYRARRAVAVGRPVMTTDPRASLPTDPRRVGGAIRNDGQPRISPGAPYEPVESEGGLRTNIKRIYG